MGTEKHADNLGQPDIKLNGLQIWIHGRQYPNEEDYWDGNWLNVTAHCGSQGAEVWSWSVIYFRHQSPDRFIIRVHTPL